jgi:SAM-dependent methyltransferase
MPAMTPLPTKLHLGCGRSFLADYLNLDIDPAAAPDIVHDLNRPFPPDRPVRMRRFGDVTIPKGHFEEILARHVLEHITDLWMAMRSCFDALADGGLLRIVVPYDLSYGAWQDPTHVRAFNERSWVYYGEWCPWPDGRLDLVSCQFALSTVGYALRDQGMVLEELARQPRAVDEMHVVLKKRIHPAS